jgi:ADP-heptose:LPS heptosyltransferase
LRDRLHALNIDLAIDFSENSPSRLLLELSGARFKYGFRHHLGPNLGLDLEGNSHDPRSSAEIVPHSNKLIGLLDWLRAMARSEPNVVRREDLGREHLASFDLDPDDRFAVMHDGARLGFSRWPHYHVLAKTMLAETDLRIVMLTDDSDMRASLPESLAGSDRFNLVDGRLSFDAFDALLHYCQVFIGNDSGPKHLASLRGAQVISLHMARNAWNEWGQESSGFILSRKVPCANCQIHHHPEECGRDFVCIRGITPEEVMEAVRRVLPASLPAAE